MTIHRRRSDLNTTPAENRAVDTHPAPRFPTQLQIQELQKELNDLNERIAELENVGHKGHAMEVLKVNAVDYARQIDELRCLLVEPAANGEPKGAFRKPQLSRS
jgi:hypothetical protein